MSSASQAPISAPDNDANSEKSREYFLTQGGASAIAERKARSSLRDKNKKARSASFTMPGRLNLVAGMTVQLNGFGIFSENKWIIEELTHSISRGGFTTTIHMRPCQPI